MEDYDITDPWDLLNLAHNRINILSEQLDLAINYHNLLSNHVGRLQSENAKFKFDYQIQINELLDALKVLQESQIVILEHLDGEANNR